MTLGEKVGGRIEVATGLKDGEARRRRAARPHHRRHARPQQVASGRGRFTGASALTGSPVQPFAGFAYP